MHHDEGIRGVRDHGLKDFSRVAERFIDAALAHRADLDQVLLGVEENDPQDFGRETASRSRDQRSQEDYLFFEPKAERLAKRRGRRPGKRKCRGATRRVEDLNGKGSAVAEGEPFKPQTVLLRWKGLRGGEQILALARHLLCLRSPAFAQGYGGQDFGELSRVAVLVVVLRPPQRSFRTSCSRLTTGSPCRKVMESYQIWLGEGPEVAVLRMLGLFDRPAGRLRYSISPYCKPAAGLFDCPSKPQ